MGRKTAVPIIGIVDDDEAVRESISNLIRSIGYKAVVFESSEALLKSGCVSEMDCLILDIHMPGLNGIELKRSLANMGSSVPIIFVSAHDDEQLRARALRHGAIAVLGKPFSDVAMVGAIHAALQPARKDDDNV
jgi:FixJ family two-component response regulator